MEEITRFDPVCFSREECDFLAENLGLAPILAQRNLNPTVNPRAVMPMIERVHALNQLQEHEGIGWVGVEALKGALKVWIEQDKKWETDYLRTRGRAPRFPSMYSYDTLGKPHRQGPESDSHRPKTYFDENGNRHEFAVEFFPDTMQPWVSPGFTEKAKSRDLSVNVEQNRIECFCGHTESFKSNSRQSLTAARARMSKHLRRATTEVDRHREAHTLEYGS